MANTRTSNTRRRASSTASVSGLPWVSELQLDAYLQARDALRRARNAAALAAQTQTPKPGTAAT